MDSLHNDSLLSQFVLPVSHSQCSHGICDKDQAFWMGPGGKNTLKIGGNGYL